MVLWTATVQAAHYGGKVEPLPNTDNQGAVGELPILKLVRLMLTVRRRPSMSYCSCDTIIHDEHRVDMYLDKAFQVAYYYNVDGRHTCQRMQAHRGV